MSSSPYPETRISSSNVLAWAIEDIFPAFARIDRGAIAAFLGDARSHAFSSPRFQFSFLDRVAFGLLIFVVLLRVCVLREAIPISRGLVTFPMLALVFAGVLSALAPQQSDAEIWSLFAAKWLVPFTLYHLAAYIFKEETLCYGLRPSR